MGFDLFHDLRTLLLHVRIPLIHIVRRGYEKSQVIQCSRFIKRGIGLMKGDVVDSAAELVLAGQIDAFRIGLPFHLHVEDFAVELFRGLGVFHV